MFLNYAREHWMKPGENPPIGLILCAEKGATEAHYALDNLRVKSSVNAKKPMTLASIADY